MKKNKKKKILVSGAGGVPSENVIRSLVEGDASQEVIGVGSEPYDLVMSAAKRKYLVPYAVTSGYKQCLLRILYKERPDLVHFNNDFEIREASRIRDDIIATGTKVFMPHENTVEVCVNKAASAEIWEREGVRIPKTIRVNNSGDLKKAFGTLSNDDGMIWIRMSEGGGGKGALPTDNYEFAKLWIDRYNGWGAFTAAELLSSKTVTWSSIWYEGELVVAQTRGRLSWNMGNRTLSGVTGVTKIGETISDLTVDKVAQEAILAIDNKPHGIFSVDMAYDSAGFPNPTEINISRFFTTIYFFTKAGLNMPQIFADIALQGKFPVLDKKINPLPDGLIWIRNMDTEAMLLTQAELESHLIKSEDMR